MKPFTVCQYSGLEVFTSEVTGKDAFELMLALLAIAITFGIDRTEQAIKNTYTKDDASKIIGLMNVAMETAVN